MDIHFLPMLYAMYRSSVQKPHSQASNPCLSMSKFQLWRQLIIIYTNSYSLSDEDTIEVRGRPIGKWEVTGEVEYDE